MQNATTNNFATVLLSQLIIVFHICGGWLLVASKRTIGHVANVANG